MTTREAGVGALSTALPSDGTRRERPWYITALRNRRLVIGGGLLLAILAVALLAQTLATHSPLLVRPEIRLAPPSTEHRFGTDNFGRDLYSRTVYGARTSLIVGGMVALLAALAGTVMGLLGGYYPRVDLALMRIMDGMMAFPGIVLAVGIMAAMGPHVGNVIVALAIVQTPRVVRLVRSVVISLRHMQYVEAARCMGVSDWRMLVRHILPNCISPLVVQCTFIFSEAVLGEASLSFLGVGAPPEIPSWGVILGEARLYIRNAPWMMFLPGMALTITVLALNLMGDGIRDWLDPRLRKTL
jgi:peptide/nickel transport system permease protein